MNRLDRCIKLDFGMVQNEIGIMCVAAGGGIILSGLSLVLLLAVPVLLIVQIVFMIKMYKKLFYTSLYGETAAFYQSLPITTEEMTAGRIFTAGTGLLMANIVSIICLIIVVNTIGIASDLLEIYIDIAGKAGQNVFSGRLLPATFLASTVSMYRQSAFILMAVVIYNSLPQRRRTDWTKVFAFVIGGAIHFAISSLGGLMEFLGAEPSALWVPAICAVFDMVLTVLFYRITVSRLKERYALS